MPLALPAPIATHPPSSQPPPPRSRTLTDAVAQGDYRLALNHAIDSREQAQNAARVGADTRAKVRGDVERSIAEVNALIAQVNAWIASPAATRTPRTRRTAQQVVTASTAEV